MNLKKKHAVAVYKRAFRIWQKAGRLSFRKTESYPMVECTACGTMFDTPYCPQCGQQRDRKQRSEFFKGTFDSIPFLNDDAKRTILHLIFRPGYMIKDYIAGKHSSYLAPMTALIIFYAFFALVSSVTMPTLSKDYESLKYADSIDSLKAEIGREYQIPELMVGEGQASEDVAVKDLVADDDDDSNSDDEVEISLGGIKFNVDKMKTIYKMYELLNLDTKPEAVDSPAKASLAAFEAALRSQGLYQFLGAFIILTLAFWSGFRRKYKMSFSASASASAYILCQLCFFRLLAILFTWGQSDKLGSVLLAVLITIDLGQMFGLAWKPAFRKAIKLGCWCLLWVVVEFILVFTVFAIIPAFELGGAA